MRSSLFTKALTAAALLHISLAAPAAQVSPGRAEPTFDQKDIQFQQDPATDEETLKYFHEPGWDEDLSHYDRRYFHGVVTDEEREDTQSHMIRAYLDYFRKEKLDTWLAHGTLLGWWWNGRRFPWDVDLDTQVSNSTLKRLGDKYNQTRNYYTSPDGKVKREYLLDVNRFIGERERGNGMNVIDARWIDIRNGLYIDITGLSETDPQNFPDVWSCKNYHMYKVADLYPMRITMFEGIAALVPYAYDKILVEEYRESALTKTWYNGYEWDREQRLWVKTEQTLRMEEEIRRTRAERERSRKLNETKLT